MKCLNKNIKSSPITIGNNNYIIKSSTKFSKLVKINKTFL